MYKRVTLGVNETRTIDLETHEGGGYLWSVVSNDESMTQVQISSQKPKNRVGPIGKSFPIQVEIKALAKGKSIVVLEEKREWEKGINPLNTCKISITIK